MWKFTTCKEGAGNVNLVECGNSQPMPRRCRKCELPSRSGNPQPCKGIQKTLIVMVAIFLLILAKVHRSSDTQRKRSQTVVNHEYEISEQKKSTEF
jgi:hypothetical protein